MLGIKMNTKKTKTRWYVLWVGVKAKIFYYSIRNFVSLYIYMYIYTHIHIYSIYNKTYLLFYITSQKNYLMRQHLKNKTQHALRLKL